jgi:hypothetical protein
MCERVCVSNLCLDLRTVGIKFEEAITFKVTLHHLGFWR